MRTAVAGARGVNPDIGTVELLGTPAPFVAPLTGVKREHGAATCRPDPWATE
jgi:hypothetical protein